MVWCVTFTLKATQIAFHVLQPGILFHVILSRLLAKVYIYRYSSNNIIFIFRPPTRFRKHIGDLKTHKLNNTEGITLIQVLGIPFVLLLRLWSNSWYQKENKYSLLNWSRMNYDKMYLMTPIPYVQSSRLCELCLACLGRV